MATLAQTLHELTAEGELYEKLGNGGCAVSLRPSLSHSEGAAGVCRVRFNDRGVLKVRSAMLPGAMRSHRKKTFFHVRPELSRSASACSVVIFTAAIARIG